MTDDEIRTVFAELQRVGVDLGRPPGLALGTGFRDGEFLAWLRALPDALGHDEFVARLSDHVSAAQPNAGALPARADGQPHRMWPTVEQLHAGIDVLAREWDPLGARLGELTVDDVSDHAYNALIGALSGQKPEDVERRISGMLASAEKEVFGLRPSPREQRRYLARRLMQIVVDDPGPPHEDNPWDDIGATAADPDEKVAGRKGSLTRARALGNTVHLGPRGDEPPALGPWTQCTECGVIGTVAVVMREVEPLVSRYCPACWSGVRDKYWGRTWRSFREPIPDRSTPEGMIAAFDRIRDEMMFAAQDPVRFVATSLWEDRLPFIEIALAANENESPARRERRLRDLARDLMVLAHQMYGPMPAEIEACVRQYATPHQGPDVPAPASSQHEPPAAS